jgi:hypothetical protein
VANLTLQVPNLFWALSSGPKISSSETETTGLLRKNIQSVNIGTEGKIIEKFLI